MNKANNRKLKILFVTSEAAPFIKTGGLADVCGSLPFALQKLNADVKVILPKYFGIEQQYKEQMKHLCDFYIDLGWRRQYCGIESIKLNGIEFLFADNEYYFAKNYVYSSNPYEDGERFSYFNKAVLEALKHLRYTPHIIHCNDWQSGMLPFLIKTQYSGDKLYKNIKTVLTIHNLRYQGQFSWEQISDLLSIDKQYFIPEQLEFYGGVNFLKAGILFADRVTTVSPTYALEITTPFFGERLDGVLRSIEPRAMGILNGIDTGLYNPKTDPYLACNYSQNDLSGKAKCKEAVQEAMWLNKRGDIPLIAMITRFADHKGLDLVEAVIEDILRLDVQIAVLGNEDGRYSNMFRSVAEKYGGRVSIKTGQNDTLARQLYAGADMFLMPSMFEPCGIAQMLAMRYGTVPIVRETGGLSDSVIPYNRYTNEGIGFSFANYNAHEMLYTIENAIGLYYDKLVWNGLVKRAMQADFSWNASAEKYLGLYKELVSK